MENIIVFGRLTRAHVVVLVVFLAVSLGILAADAKPALANHDYTTKDCESYLAARAAHPPSYWEGYDRDGGGPACLYVEVVDSAGVPISPKRDDDSDGRWDNEFEYCMVHDWPDRPWEFWGTCGLGGLSGEAQGLWAGDPSNAARGENYMVNAIKQTGCAKARASNSNYGPDREHLVYGDIVKVTLVDMCADTTAPKGTVKINGGRPYTKSPSVNLSPSASDTGSGLASMRFKNDGAGWSAWMPYTTSKSWTLRNANGTRTVYAQYKDKAGNVSTTALDRIVLDTVKPRISGMTPRHRSITRDTTPTIAATVKDSATNLRTSNVKLYVAGKRVTKFRYSAATDKLTYTSPRLSKGKKVVKIVARDAAGNVGARSWYFTIR